MKLTDYTDYSLRTLIFAALAEDRLVTIQEISDAFGIPRNHLVKIVHSLGKLGYLTTLRGRMGGIRLSRPASKINVGDVVRSMEPDFHMVECFNTEHNQCVITAACGLRVALSAATKAYMDSLSRLSVADLIVKRQPLMHLLNAGTSMHFVPPEQALTSRKRRTTRTQETDA